MRKILASVLAVLLCFATAESSLSVCKAGGGYDVSDLTQEELIQLRNDINARLVPTEEEAVIYDSDGIYVTWFGIEDEDRGENGHRYQIDYLISNQTDEAIYVNFKTIAINGFTIVTSNAMALEIPAHTSTYTAATNRWLFDTDTLNSIRFSGAFESVSVHMDFYAPDEDGKCSYKDPFAEVDSNIAIKNAED